MLRNPPERKAPVVSSKPNLKFENALSITPKYFISRTYNFRTVKVYAKIKLIRQLKK